MLLNKKNIKIIGMTTDPYDDIYGYSLVFFKLFKYIAENNPQIDITLYSNNGLSSRVVTHSKIKTVYINQTYGKVLKTLLLSWKFIRIGLNYDRNTIFLANCEIPELLAVLFLKVFGKKTFCLLQDDRVRGSSLFIIIICKLRIKLMELIGKVIFVNKYTMDRFSNTVSKYYLGNPVFSEII